MLCDENRPVFVGIFKQFTQEILKRSSTTFWRLLHFRLIHWNISTQFTTCFNGNDVQLRELWLANCSNWLLPSGNPRNILQSRLSARNNILHRQKQLRSRKQHSVLFVSTQLTQCNATSQQVLKRVFLIQ